MIVHNLLSQFWNEKVQETAERFNEDQIEFLFTYFFTESKEKRERMWADMQKKYEAKVREIEYIAEKIQLLNIQYKEYLSSQKDVETFLK